MSLAEIVMPAVLRHRRENNWLPGQVWDPYAGRYRDRQSGDDAPFAGSDAGSAYKSGARCKVIADAPFIPNAIQRVSYESRKRCGCRTCQRELG